ncbi:unnamed protein product [Calicophoron daubneyi]|uniref:ADP-dependent glucokinase n=1 Tax=Calicophoron daubneyi TaxID=300641 RepID=A0AAV2T1C9_CALDB
MSSIRSQGRTLHSRPQPAVKASGCVMGKGGGYGLVWGAVLFALAAVLTVRFRYAFLSDLPADIKQVIKSLARLESAYKPLPQRSPGPRVIVGFGACVDLRVKATTLFKELGISPLSMKTEDARLHGDYEELNSLEDFIRGFSAAFVSGAAAERVLRNLTVFNKLVETAASLVPDQFQDKFLSHVTSETDSINSETQHPSACWSLGGNAPLMSLRLAREGAEVSLAARLSQRVHAAIPTNIRVLTAPAAFGLPDVPKEDIHLILEYESGERWGDLQAPRANRYIIVHDEETSRLSGFWPDLLESWRRFEKRATSSSQSPSPDLFVVSGLQVMDSWAGDVQADIRLNRLDELSQFLSRIPPETLNHFEMASYVNASFAREMLRSVMPHMDSIGLNEQELPNLVSLLTNGTITTISSAYPPAADMLDAMRSAWALLTDPSLPKVNSASGSGWRRISRIHLHTLAYQLIMVRRHAQGGGAARRELEAITTAGGMPIRRSDVGLAWPFARAAVAKASLIAHRHTCASSAIDPVKTRLLMDDSFAITADPGRWKSALLATNKPYSNGIIRTGGVPRIHFNDTAPVTCWTEPEPTLMHPDFRGPERVTAQTFDTVIEICVAPVLVCSQVRQTVGAGDNISAGALRVQTTAQHV